MPIEIVIPAGTDMKYIGSYLAKFKNKVAKEGIMDDIRRKECHVKPSIAKRNKSAKARKEAAKLQKKREASLKDR